MIADYVENPDPVILLFAIPEQDDLSVDAAADLRGPRKDASRCDQVDRMQEGCWDVSERD